MYFRGVQSLVHVTILGSGLVDSSTLANFSSQWTCSIVPSLSKAHGDCFIPNVQSLLTDTKHKNPMTNSICDELVQQEQSELNELIWLEVKWNVIREAQTC